MREYLISYRCTRNMMHGPISFRAATKQAAIETFKRRFPEAVEFNCWENANGSK